MGLTSIGFCSPKPEFTTSRRLKQRRSFDVSGGNHANTPTCSTPRPPPPFPNPTKSQLTRIAFVGLKWLVVMIHGIVEKNADG
jgi:hypothetical protein